MVDRSKLDALEQELADLQRARRPLAPGSATSVSSLRRSRHIVEELLAIHLDL